MDSNESFVPVYVSETDFDLVPAVRHLHEKFGVENCLVLLWGFDKNYNGGDFYEVEECEHVNRQGGRVTGKRYSGAERLDSDWLSGNMASDAAKLAAKGDISLSRELASLSKRSVG